MKKKIKIYFEDWNSNVFVDRTLYKIIKSKMKISTNKKKLWEKINIITFEEYGNILK